MKITINNEEVLCDKDFKIEEEMLNTSSVILNNVYPKTWEQDKDYTSRFYYPPDYSKCKIFNEIYHPEEKSTASGTSFTLNNVDLDKEYYIEDLKGQTTQSGTPTPTSPVPINTTTGRQVVSVCGKNFLPNNQTTQTINGITFTMNNDKSVSISGTASAPTDYYFVGGASQYINLGLPSGNYNLSGVVGGSLATYMLYCVQNRNGTLYYYQSVGTTGQVINIQSGDTFRFFIRVLKDAVVNTTIKPMLESGTTASTYEEYKGQDYEINLGKNCFDGINKETFISAAANQCNVYPGNVGGYVIVSGGKYTISTTTTQNKYRVGCVNNIPGTSLAPCYNGVNKDNTTSTITIDTTGYQYLIVYATDLSAIQVEKGNVVTDFAEYKTPIELCKIGNYQDYIFKNEINNPNYDSNLELDSWYLHKEIGKVSFTSLTNWKYESGNKRFSTTISGSRTENQRFPIISNYFSYASSGGANGIGFNYGGAIYLYNYDCTINAQFQTWLGTHPTDVYYVLATPTTTLIEDEELINQLESIRLISGLNNVNLSSPNLPFIMDLVYNYVPAYTEEDILFCGVVENTGNISLNPREPHYCNLQVLDFKTFLSEGETLDFVIYEKTILEAIDQVIGVIQPYGFVKGNVNILHGDDVIGAYSTKDKTAYDVFNYLADITQSRWTTRMIDEDTVAIDFYDPTLMPQGTAIQYNNTWFCNNNILDMSFSYSSRDYRNKQVMLSGEVYANIETTEVITADGYQTQFNTTDKIGYVSSIAVNGNPATIITKEEYDLGYEGDFYYQPGNPYFESDNLVSAGAIITIVYYAVIEGREVLLNQVEVNKINSMTNRKGVIARYETRNDATTTQELNQIGQSYLKYKGSPEVSLKIISTSNIWNIGERVQFTAPLDELTTEYMVKKKTINYITTQENIFYTFELSSSFNSETEINYFDNQRAKTMGNIGAGEFISRNIDIENTANVIFYDLEVNEVQVSGDSILQSELQAPLGVE